MIALVYVAEAATSAYNSQCVCRGRHLGVMRTQFFSNHGATHMKGGMNNLMRQAQQMQKKIQEAQEEIGEQTFEASTGGGVVTAKVNGRQELLDIDIDPEVLDPEDAEMVEEMVTGAVNQAMETAGETMSKEIEKITGGMNIPGMF